jgi:hypothetical protein
VNEKRTSRVNEVIASLLRDGEQVEVASLASVGSVSLGRKLAVAAAAGVLSGGMLIVNTRPARWYVVLTNQRLLFLEPSWFSGRPTAKVTGQVPRAAIAGMSTPKRGVTMVFDVLISGQDKALRLSFPRPHRDDGDKVAAALGTATVQ